MLNCYRSAEIIDKCRVSRYCVVMTSATLTTASPLVRSPKACEVAGITYRQLDYWVRTGLFSPSVKANGPGSRRQFSPGDVRALAALGEWIGYNADREICRRTAGELADLARDLDVEGAIALPREVLALNDDAADKVIAHIRDGRGTFTALRFLDADELDHALAVPPPRRDRPTPNADRAMASVGRFPRPAHDW